MSDENLKKLRLEHLRRNRERTKNVGKSTKQITRAQNNKRVYGREQMSDFDKLRYRIKKLKEYEWCTCMNVRDLRLRKSVIERYIPEGMKLVDFDIIKE